mmetsp:Transcript_25152/g.59808  ORF Transcript_25152/g.59808 Transcript_25152/m.59808 type:complete len:204 (+) Transcript_25152:1716-2327(+)
MRTLLPDGVDTSSPSGRSGISENPRAAARVHLQGVRREEHQLPQAGQRRRDRARGRPELRRAGSPVDTPGRGLRAAEPSCAPLVEPVRVLGHVGRLAGVPHVVAVRAPELEPQRRGEVEGHGAHVRRAAQGRVPHDDAPEGRVEAPVRAQPPAQAAGQADDAREGVLAERHAPQAREVRAHVQEPQRGGRVQVERGEGDEAGA